MQLCSQSAHALPLLLVADLSVSLCIKTPHCCFHIYIAMSDLTIQHSLSTPTISVLLPNNLSSRMAITFTMVHRHNLYYVLVQAVIDDNALLTYNVSTNLYCLLATSDRPPSHLLNLTLPSSTPIVLVKSGSFLQVSFYSQSECAALYINSI
jgi:hypothetical protein